MGKMAGIKGVPFVVRSDDSDSRCMSLKDIPAEDRVNSSEYPVLQMIEEPFNAAMWAIAEGGAATAEETMAVFEQCCGISRTCSRNKKESASVRSCDAPVIRNRSERFLLAQMRCIGLNYFFRRATIKPKKQQELPGGGFSKA